MAEGHPVSMTAATGTTELHHEMSFMGLTPPAFVALSMLVVVGIILWAKVPKMIAGMLDSRIAQIKAQLDEASKLRAEAEAELAQAKARNAASEGDAAAIVAHAEAEAKAMLAKAETDAAELVSRRTKMAEDKITAAERSAVADVRARAANAAAHVAAQVIAGTHGADADKALIDRAISGLGLPN